MRPVVVLAAALGIAGAAVSMIGSWIPSLWGDEAASVMSARRPLGSLFMMLTHIDAVHGLYYLGLHFWIRMTGLSPFAMRLPSAIAIGLMVAGVVWLASRFGSLRFAAAAGVFAAVMPQLTYAGEEVRAYAFDAMLATALAIVLAEIVLGASRPDAPGGPSAPDATKRTRRLWVAYGVVLCVGIYTFLYLALMIAVAGLVLALTPAVRGQWRRWLTASGWAVLAASPVIGLAIAQRNQIGFLESRTITLRNVVVDMWFGRLLFAGPAWILIAVAVVGFAVEVVRARRAGCVLGPRLEPLALVWLIVPMGIVLAMVPVMAGFTPRYATYSAPAAAVLMALGVRRIVRVARRAAGGIPALAVGAVVTAAVVVLAAPIWAAQRGPYAMNRSDWNEIAATISSQARPGDGIVFDKTQRPSRRPIMAMDTNPEAFRNVTDLTVRIPFTQNTLWNDEVYTVAHAARLGRFEGVHRVWMVQYLRSGQVGRWGVGAMHDMGFRPVREIREHSSVVTLYER
jgi:mannosyltransferase